MSERDFLRVSCSLYVGCGGVAQLAASTRCNGLRFRSLVLMLMRLLLLLIILWR